MILVHNKPYCEWHFTSFKKLIKDWGIYRSDWSVKIHVEWFLLFNLVFSSSIEQRKKNEGNSQLMNSQVTHWVWICHQFDSLGESKMAVEEQLWEVNENALRWTETERTSWIKNKEQTFSPAQRHSSVLIKIPHRKNTWVA